MTRKRDRYYWHTIIYFRNGDIHLTAYFNHDQAVSDAKEIFYNIEEVKKVKVINMAPLFFFFFRFQSIFSLKK